MQKDRKRMTNSKTILLGFLVIILVGALLLMLPFATKEGQKTTFSGALFTAVSSTCVTGLVVYDTWAHWTLFGQLVLLTLIQIGGLGFITIGTFVMIALRKKIGLSGRTLIQESLSTLQIRGSVKLVRRIIFGTLVFESIGALILSTRFIPDLGVGRGLYYSVFHSVSAFCNAGFDLMGFRGEFSSFCTYQSDPTVVLTLSALILIGGVGFTVWEDVYENTWHWRRYRFHTKVVLLMTAVLTIGGSGLLLLFENGGLFSQMTVGEKLLSALFGAVTPRTAGFNTVDTAALSNGGMLTTIALMFIGGSPGSTAGGIKTTTLFAIFMYIKAYLMREKDCVAFRSRMEDEGVKKACVVVFINLFLAIAGSMVIFSTQTLPFRDVLFEVFSAGGTVGMSTGVTRELGALSRIAVMLLMYCGRMGSLTFAMSFTEHRKLKEIRYPEEQMPIG